MNPFASRIVGIDTRTMSLIAFAISGFLGAIAGIIVAPITLMQYDTGLLIGLKGFVACIIGGFGNPFGALFGGLLLGIVESLSAGYLSSGYKNAIAFVLLLGFLIFRPEGNFPGNRQQAHEAGAMRTVIALGCVAVLPFFGSDYLTNLLIIVMLHALPALGVSLLMGYTGQISLGHAAFYGLGAYGAAAFSVHLGLNPWISIVLAVILVGVTSSYLGWVIFRLRGHYLAVATLGFGFIVNIAFVELRDWTGGPNGCPASRRSKSSDSRSSPIRASSTSPGPFSWSPC